MDVQPSNKDLCALFLKWTSFFSGKPILTYEPSMKDQSLKASHTLIILVNIEATPTPTVKWFDGDKELHHGGNVTIETEETFSRLTIKGITGKQSGAYRIVAENKVGKAEEEFSVTIKGNQSKVIFLQLSLSFHNLSVPPRNYSHILSYYGFCDFKDTHNWRQCIPWYKSIRTDHVHY